MKIFIKVVAFSTLLCAGSSSANNRLEPRVFIDKPQNVCWYNGAEYSEGAVIKQLDWLFACEPRFRHEQNGVVIWVRIDEEGKRIEPENRATININ
ncbi:DUF1496 domain-containing protein [Pseudoalteromonas fenneropenaei]|uniref:DUF1496 domain-containing protein n=1 Tax=Pseudoalteromonas fenneropenaei TaxID=1737459 RepID=A0ABV7CQ65_9GAMM